IELETGKAVTAIPASTGGTVGRISVKSGDKISVGAVLMTVSGNGAAPAPVSKPAAPKPAKSAAKAKRPEPEPELEEDEAEEVASDEEEDGEGSAAEQAGLPIAASPSVRWMAHELGINLRKIKGSGNGGRIQGEDLRNYVQRLIKLAQKASAPASGKTGAAAPVPERIDFSRWGSILKKPMTPLRQTISRRMVENSVSIPHVTQFDDVDVTALNDLRKKLAPAYEAKGTRLTLTAFVIKVVANTLKKFPLLNSSVDEVANEIILKEYVHIGIAVDTEQGLLVPVIRDCDKKSILQLSQDLNQLAEKARERKVTMEEMSGGSFTISNQGGIGGAHFTPIINKPEVAILGLGRSATKAVVREGKIEARLMMPIAISYDHRIIDGGEAARFTVELVRAFENFKEEDAKL
ncbi:MAG: 2-oxo acid dehydrogenase subunit E2, partial [Verrucomicrobiota bacterium]|nr:2-oxo acid dehydrogenase subunit E2 [Verrucomicrobiota bacterium]